MIKKDNKNIAKSLLHLTNYKTNARRTYETQQE